MSLTNGKCDRCKKLIRQYVSPCPGCLYRTCAGCRSLALGNASRADSIRRCDSCTKGKQSCAICGENFDVFDPADILGKNPVAWNCKSCGRPTCRSCGRNDWNLADAEERTCRRCLGAGPIAGCLDAAAGINLEKDFLRWPALAEKASLLERAMPARLRGPEPSPSLDDLTSPEESSRAWAAYRLRRSPVNPAAIVALSKALSDRSAAVRVYAAGALGGMAPRLPEPQRKPVLIALTRAVRDPEWSVRAVSLMAIAELDRFEPSSLSALVAALTDAQPLLRNMAAAMLVGADTVADRLVPLLLASLERNPEHAITIARIFQRLGSSGQAGFDALRRAAEASEGIARQELLKAVAEVAPAGEAGASAAASSAIELVKTVRGYLRLQAAESLKKQTVPLGALPVLVDALDDDWPSLSGALINAIVSIGADTVPGLISGLDDPRPKVRSRVIAALGRLRDAALPALKRLDELILDTDPLVSNAAARALGELEPLAAAGRVSSPRGGDEQARLAYVQGAAKVGSDNAIELLVQSLKDPSPKVRAAAATKLAMGDSARPEVAAALLGACADADASVRSAAVHGVRHWTELPDGAEQAYRALLLDSSISMWDTVKTAFGLAGKPGAQLLSLLAEDGDPRVRRKVAELLSRSVNLARECPEALRKLLHDADSALRKSVVQALGKLQPEPMIVAAVEEATKDPVASVRFEAMSVLKRWPARKGGV
ncbi:MAG: HEAT repeat domain-containing protein [Candidatus Wallbacteria bacterium]|nr:HEAT repeat domain-containing protein [Candidatus Wallbacteria bacterium]